MWLTGFAHTLESYKFGTEICDICIQAIKELQSMPKDTYYHTYVCPHMCDIHSTSKNSPVPISISAIQLHMPSRNFVVATATPASVTFSFHNSALSCFMINETFNMHQQQETLHFGCTNLASHMPFQMIKNNHSCRPGCMCKLKL